MSGRRPPPQGSIIRYAYLWADEHEAGREEGRKDRPSLVLALAVRTEPRETHVLVLAVTHTPPRDRLDAVPFPEAEKRRLGLDDIPTWIVATEANSFVWPVPTCAPFPAGPPGRGLMARFPRPSCSLSPAPTSGTGKGSAPDWW